MGGFGQYLVENGVLTSEQLDEALRFQQVYGGRIGTVVVDLGYLVVEELAEHLSDALLTPLPPPAWLESPDPQALKQVPPPMIRRCQALPLRLEGGSLHVAMLDPTDPEKLDFLAMASSRPVIPYVLPERRLLYWLEVHCGIDRPPRFVGMVTRPRQIGLTEEEVASGTPMLDTRQRIAHVAAQASDMHAVAPAAAAPLPPIQAAPGPSTVAVAVAVAPPVRDETGDDEILLLDELVAEAPAAQAWKFDGPGETPAPLTADQTEPAEPRSIRISQLEARLYQSRNRDEVIALALEIASAYCASAALFVVRGESVSLFRASGPAAGAEELEIPISTPSLFTRPAESGLPFRGAPAQGGVDGRVLEGLGRGIVAEILVHPIVIRNRVVNLLYADNGPETLGETSVGALTALCETLAGAYERLIADQKREGQG